MFKIRKSESRGSANYGWLNTKYTFSFANYYDPNHMGFGSLIVINEDVIAAGKGFGAHGHDNMEILTYIISGSLEHKDSMGSVFVVKEGDVQRMSAGYGVTHSEFNHSKHKDVHLLQIWFKPNKIDVDPSYEQKNFTKESKLGKAKLIVSTNGDDDSLSINQKLNIYSSNLVFPKKAKFGCMLYLEV
jgi:quercetin 2,3-dioxygenase